MSASKSVSRPVNSAEANIFLSIIITVVSGKQAVRRCLKALCPQVDPAETEILVPYDAWAIDVGELSTDFPGVQFHLIAGPDATTPVRSHSLYNRRRSAGLGLARGRVIAMTEDHAVPAA